ncbi:MAG: hypothetical protein Q9166_005534 [cf. Caloplaca sp. 2 TL-2023]
MHGRMDCTENQPLYDSSKSRSNPKKRPSTSNLSGHPVAAQRGLVESNAANGADIYPQKKSRAADWPLRSTDESNNTVITHRRAHKPPRSPGQWHNHALRPRPSKFLEGSMNDRVSKKPPSIYLRDERVMEDYHDQASAHGFDSQASTAMDDDKNFYDAGIETAKPSGMYRFGKALASAFNPVNVWQGINGYWKIKEEKSHPDKTLLQERKIKAEQIYAEMKKDGFKGTRPFAYRGSSIDGSGFSERTSQDDSMKSSLHDSGVDFDEPYTLTMSSTKQPTPIGSEDVLIATSLLRSRRAASPIPEPEHGRKTSLTLPRPSFQGLKKVKSHIQLPSTKRKGADVPLLFPGIPSEPRKGQTLNRQPSRKDLAKQRKLSKQVSDLESKLQVARRELEISRGQIPDVPKIPKSGRKPFKPGALPSLPSESLLKSTDVSVQAESDSEWKPSTSRKSREEKSTKVSFRPESDSEWKPSTARKSHEQTSTPKKPAIKASTTKTPQSTGKTKQLESAPTSSAKRRRSSSGRDRDKSYKPRQSTDNGSDSDWGVTAKTATRACKAQKTESSSAVDTEETKPQQPPIGPHKGTRWPTPTTQSTIPPVTTLVARFDPAKVDKEKLLAMRSVPKDNLPFGSHLDDIVNLQKEYPDCPQRQLDDYLSGLSKGPEKGSSPASPSKALRSEDLLARTRSPTCKNSPPSRLLTMDLSTIDEAITMDPSKDKSIPPLPRSPMKGTRNPQMSRIASTGKKNVDKLLPNIQKEDYKWPEDVF